MRESAKVFGFLFSAAMCSVITLSASDYLIGPSPGRYALAPIYTSVADYVGVNVDHSSFRNLAHIEPGIRSILSSDVLLYGSSKGLLGLRARLLNDIFDKRAKFYNTSVAYGEALPFLAQIIAQNGIHDRIVVADVTDVASQFAMSPPAIEAMDMGTMKSATRAVISNARYQGDLLLSSDLPAVTLGKEGFGVEGRLMPYEVRDPDTGDDEASAPGGDAHPIVLGDLDMELGPYGGLRDRVLPFLRCRNITIIAIAIPFSAAPGNPNQFDPTFTEKAAKELGFTYLAIPYQGLYTRDWVHLSYKSSFELTRRLADALSSLGDKFGDTIARNRESQKHGARNCNMPGITSAVKLISTDPNSYVISFHGNRFVIPNDAKIDWDNPRLRAVPGIVRAP